jgi:hypothetical protein
LLEAKLAAAPDPAQGDDRSCHHASPGVIQAQAGIQFLIALRALDAVFRRYDVS